LPPCMETMRAADNAVRAALNSGSANHGVVRIGFAGALSTAVVASLARAVRELYPRIE
jgi:DNA-binding transcriptional LysR family regulator